MYHFSEKNEPSVNHLSLKGTVPLKPPQSLIFLLGCPRKFEGTFMWNLVDPQLLTAVEP